MAELQWLGRWPGAFQTRREAVVLTFVCACSQLWALRSSLSFCSSSQLRLQAGGSSPWMSAARLVQWSTTRASPKCVAATLVSAAALAHPVSQHTNLYCISRYPTRMASNALCSSSGSARFTFCLRTRCCCLSLRLLAANRRRRC